MVAKRSPFIIVPGCEENLFMHDEEGKVHINSLFVEYRKCKVNLKVVTNMHPIIFRIQIVVGRINISDLFVQERKNAFEKLKEGKEKLSDFEFL